MALTPTVWLWRSLSQLVKVVVMSEVQIEPIVNTQIYVLMRYDKEKTGQKEV